MDINTSGALKSYPAQRLTGSAYWLDTELFKKLLMSIVEQLSRTGVKIIIGHGHGPSINAFANIAADAQKMYGVKLYTAWSFAENEELKFQNDHAGANETSIVMAFRPDLVDFSRVKEDESNASTRLPVNITTLSGERIFCGVWKKDQRVYNRMYLCRLTFGISTIV